MTKPWFLVMTPEDANRPDSAWVREGAASRGKMVVRPIAPEGWIALIVFVLILVGAMAGIWIGGVRAGALSLPSALLISVVAATVVIVAFIWLVRATMTRLPPAGDQPR